MSNEKKHIKKSLNLSSIVGTKFNEVMSFEICQIRSLDNSGCTYVDKNLSI